MQGTLTGGAAFLPPPKGSGFPVAELYEALEAIRKLVDETNSHYILLSYNSNGRATERELISMLNNTGKLLNIFSIDYKKNVMSNMCWTNDWKSENNKNKEFLFLLER